MPKTSRLPKGFRRGHDGSLACPHRDCSTCEDCAGTYSEIVDVVGAHFWIADPEERAVLRAEISVRECPCWQSMRCLCAGHARGAPASEPCDTKET